MFLDLAMHLGASINMATKAWCVQKQFTKHCPKYTDEENGDKDVISNANIYICII